MRHSMERSMEHSMGPIGASVSGAYWAQHVLGTSNASHRMLAGGSSLWCWVGEVGTKQVMAIAQSPPSTPRCCWLILLSTALLVHLFLLRCTYLCMYSLTYLPMHLPIWPGTYMHICVYAPTLYLPGYFWTYVPEYLCNNLGIKAP